jgi:hypothetical protein
MLERFSSRACITEGGGRHRQALRCRVRLGPFCRMVFEGFCLVPFSTASCRRPILRDYFCRPHTHMLWSRFVFFAVVCFSRTHGGTHHTTTTHASRATHVSTEPPTFFPLFISYFASSSAWHEPDDCPGLCAYINRYLLMCLSSLERWWCGCWSSDLVNLPKICSVGDQRSAAPTQTTLGPAAKAAQCVVGGTGGGALQKTQRPRCLCLVFSGWTAESLLLLWFVLFCDEFGRGPPFAENRVKTEEH